MDTEGYVPNESEEDSDSEKTRSEEMVQRNSRPEPNPAQEERRSKKRHDSNDATEEFSGLQQSEDHTLAETIRHIRKRKNEEKEEKNNKKKKQPHGKSPTKSANVEPEHEPPQQPRQLEEETPIQQPQPQPNPNNNLLRMTTPRGPTSFGAGATFSNDGRSSLPLASCRGPIYPTQEVIDVSSGSEDERQPLIPKTEEYHAYSPSARIITEVLMSMNRDETPSFDDLGIDPPLP
ncbi:hypothetical protein PIB30_076455 [Stylosanthes scabra]|uniref:Uncharacterized protein n=1 Tax=Stylosanthes scabra TaxID=79078 RepID=A0ABU6YP94_9FABA|nr:hypothetical protein [Stylosanthes scabra]